MKRAILSVAMVLFILSFAHAVTVYNEVGPGEHVETTLSEPPFASVIVTTIDSRNVGEVDGAIFGSWINDDGDQEVLHRIEGEKIIQTWYDNDAPLDGTVLFQHFHPGPNSYNDCLFWFSY